MLIWLNRCFENDSHLLPLALRSLRSLAARYASATVGTAQCSIARRRGSERSERGRHFFNLHPPYGVLRITLNKA
jgi:hypothetical protein